MGKGGNTIIVLLYFQKGGIDLEYVRSKTLVFVIPIRFLEFSVGTINTLNKKNLLLLFKLQTCTDYYLMASY